MTRREIEEVRGSRGSEIFKNKGRGIQGSKGRRGEEEDVRI